MNKELGKWLMEGILIGGGFAILVALHGAYLVHRDRRKEKEA